MNSLIETSNEVLNVNGTDVSFLHHKNGENYFNSKTIENLYGISRQLTQYHLDAYLEAVEASRKDYLHEANPLVVKQGRTRYYSFDCLTYVAFRLNNKEAWNYRLMIKEMLNDKFNSTLGIGTIEDVRAKSLKCMEYYRKLAPYYADLHRMKYRYKNPKFNTEMATVGRIMDECIEASRLLDCTATVDKGLKLYEKLNIEPVQTILVGASTSQPLDSPNTGIIAKLESEFRR